MTRQPTKPKTSHRKASRHCLSNNSRDELISLLGLDSSKDREKAAKAMQLWADELEQIVSS